VPFGTRVRVWIGDPIPRHAGENQEVLLGKVEDQIRAALENHRERPGSKRLAAHGSRG
jgi:hypothetical protein